MANWKHTLDFSEFYHSDFRISEIAALCAKKIQRTLPSLLDIDSDDFDPGLEDIVWAFESVEDVEEFDDIMSGLYDWGDLTVSDGDIGRSWPTKMCWIKTQL